MHSLLSHCIALNCIYLIIVSLFFFVFFFTRIYVVVSFCPSLLVGRRLKNWHCIFVIVCALFFKACPLIVSCDFMWSHWGTPHSPHAPPHHPPRPSPGVRLLHAFTATQVRNEKWSRKAIIEMQMHSASTLAKIHQIYKYI